MDNGKQNSEPNVASPAASSSAQPAQAGIFSAGDLGVNTENLPPELGGTAAPSAPVAPSASASGAVAGSPDNSSRVASALGKRTQSYTNPFRAGEPAPSGRIETSVTSDLRLTPSEKPRRRKAPLIVALIVLILGAGAFGAWLWLNQNNSSSSASFSESEKSFAHFATYMLFGEEKDALDATYDSAQNYLLNEKLSSAYDDAYWSKADELLTKASESVAALDNSRLSNLLDAYRHSFDFLRFYHRIGDPSQDELFGTYLTSGLDGAKTALNTFYYGFSTLRSDTVKTYAEERKQYYLALVELYSIYNQMGCVQNGEINESACATPTVSQQQRIMTLSSEISQYSRSTSATIDGLIRHVISYCWDLDGWLKNPATLEGDTNE